MYIVYFLVGLDRTKLSGNTNQTQTDKQKKSNENFQSHNKFICTNSIHIHMTKINILSVYYLIYISRPLLLISIASSVVYITDK